MAGTLVELGKRLALYRRNCDPATYGIQVVGTRRTPGLRREEVAKLTGFSVDLISKLERGKYPSVSLRLLRELSKLYRLDEATRAALFHLANLEARDSVITLATSLPPALQGFIDHQREYPTFVINRRWDFVGWNDALSLVFGEIGEMPPDRRNILWILFGNPEAKNFIVDWERHARRVMGQFRLDYDWARGDARFAALVSELSAVSHEFADWWSVSLDVKFKETVRKQVRHPQLGMLDFEQMAFRLLADPDLLIGVHFPTNDETKRHIRAALAARPASTRQ